jgi:hypothetical protein
MCASLGDSALAASLQALADVGSASLPFLRYPLAMVPPIGVTEDL